ncbi:hypothetical protein COS55_01025 [Candidatus Shapirobacteria bacterium CG03_land_8_20_14_0_80_40_19]|uniref:Glycoside hydrolase family 5 domain-containing protein n=1 Tax=Candidatus Shapirobacteria bacterium CG03_land_8_20_14_0_80_40_19 TaxID=1974880 RepID=A0A2M7BF85_9BACT|nr:MAG: hypothetical protein COS55_01025 [Candidatus Shapirobacteria bacterium CG03_land_8_20_14_0_80_40_19]
MLVIFLILSFLAIFSQKTVFAVEPINKFGIHILEPYDLPKAQELVNSSGGDWGWVTTVIRDDDMNLDKWQGFMNECRERHLIPIVRIATHLEAENWAKPKIDDVNNWVNFLNSLNWPVSDQYIIIFNEPNQAKEWGGEINPKEYAEILLDFSAKFKNQTAKFMILNAGLDLAAPNSKTTMESFKFMQQMNHEVPEIFEQIDGWNSHSYPNHGYLGKPWENSKHSVKGYEWELQYLKRLGVKKDLSVFITETGWPHQISNFKFQISNYYSENISAEYMKYAFENVWLKDNKIVAVTPFVLNYPGELFVDFSWIDPDGNTSQQYNEIKSLAKVAWHPIQEFKAEVISITVPPFLPVNTEFVGKIAIKNSGQSIWGESSNKIVDKNSDINLEVSDLLLSDNQKIYPNDKVTLDFTLNSSSKSGIFSFGWKKMGEYQIEVFPASTITSFRYNFWQKVILKFNRIFNRS